MLKMDQSSQYLIREASRNDIPLLAKLHAVVWRETYEPLSSDPNFQSPSYQLREKQWQDAFTNFDGSWFCYVVEKSNLELIGFAKVKQFSSDELPQFTAELNKLYLLNKYQNIGLGRMLICEVVRRLMYKGSNSMIAFTDPRNSVGQYFESLAAQKIYSKTGEFHGGYGWTDLSVVAEFCPKNSSGKNKISPLNQLDN